MAMPIEFWIYIGYGLFAMVVVFGILNFLLGGFLIPFLKVKKSRGRKILVRLKHHVQDYFCDGQIDEGILVFKDREKNTRRIPMQQGVVSRAATVYWVELDDETNAFYIRQTGVPVSTYDATKVDNLLVRALMRPGIFGDQMVKFVVVGGIILIAAVGIVGFLVYKNGVGMNQVLEAVKAINVGVVQ